MAGGVVTDVFLSEDGDWQFFDANGVPDEAEAMCVSLQNMIKKDPTLEVLAEMSEGTYASRQSRADNWIFRAYESRP